VKDNSSLELRSRNNIVMCMMFQEHLHTIPVDLLGLKLVLFSIAFSISLSTVQ
jgi:hypothetical protein